MKQPKRKKPPCIAHGTTAKPVTKFVVLRGGRICALGMFGFHALGVLVVARDGEAEASFRVHADGRSRYNQLEKPKVAARGAIYRTRKIIRTVKGSLLHAAALRLLNDRGRFVIRGVAE